MAKKLTWDEKCRRQADRFERKKELAMVKATLAVIHSDDMIEMLVREFVQDGGDSGTVGAILAGLVAATSKDYIRNFYSLQEEG